MNYRLYNFVFTLNNWQKHFNDRMEVESYFSSLDYIRYYSIGFEVAPTTNTLHLQGYVQLKTQQRFNKILLDFKNSHIEKAMSFEKAIEYTQKEKDFIEFGVPKKQGSRTDLNDFIDAIKEGFTDLELLDEFPRQYLLYENKISKLRSVYKKDFYTKNNRDNIKTFYVYGDSGTGKTSSIYRYFDYADVYRVSNYEVGMFDNYESQKVLVLDEFTSSIPFNLLLNITDRYPLMLPARYNDKVACFDIVIIISNLPFTHQYQNIKMDEPLRYEAIKRRINDVIPVNNSKELLKYNEVLNTLIDEPKEKNDTSKTLFDIELPF